MVRAACVTALLVLSGAAAGGCGGDDPPPVGDACLRSGATLVTALQRAPGAVRLPDQTLLSTCISHAISDADLQGVGVIFTAAGETLRERAAAGDVRAAVQLGYLIGAVRRGARTTTGVLAELQHKMERIGGALEADAPDAIDLAVERGAAAGVARG